MPTTSTGMGPFSELMSLGETDLTANYADNRVAFNTHGSETAVIYVSHQNSGGETVQVQVEVWDAVQGWWVVPYDNGTNVITSQLTMTNADKNTRWSLKRLARFETQIRDALRLGTAPRHLFP